MPLRRFPSKSNVPRDRESDDARWKTMGVAGKSVRKGEREGVKAGIGNVPKLLYRRSIYGDEKHSLPSTPVAPARVHDSPEASYPASALLMLGTATSNPSQFQFEANPFTNLPTLPGRRTFGIALSLTSIPCNFSSIKLITNKCGPCYALLLLPDSLFETSTF